MPLVQVFAPPHGAHSQRGLPFEPKEEIVQTLIPQSIKKFSLYKAVLESNAWKGSQ
jgi:hypothetical protein